MAYSRRCSPQSIAPLPGLHLVGAFPSVIIRKQLDGGFVRGAKRGVVPIMPSSFKYAIDLMPAMQEIGAYIKPRLSVSNFWREFTTPETWALDQISPFEKNRILQPHLH